MQDICIISNLNNQIHTMTSEKEAETKKFQIRQHYENCLNDAKKHIQANPSDDEWQERYDTYKKILDSGFSAITIEEFSMKERQKWLKGKPEPISQKIWYERMDLENPVKWCERNDFHMFCSAEMAHGPYAYQYAHNIKNNTYWKKIVDIYDISTWIDMEFIRRKELEAKLQNIPYETRKSYIEEGMNLYREDKNIEDIIKLLHTKHDLIQIKSTFSEGDVHKQAKQNHPTECNNIHDIEDTILIQELEHRGYKITKQ